MRTSSKQQRGMPTVSARRLAATLPRGDAEGGFRCGYKPPYVRQEWIPRTSFFFGEAYRAYDGVADLYTSTSTSSASSF